MTELDSFLSLYSPEVRALALQTRALVLDALPGAIEMVDPPSKIIAYGYSGSCSRGYSIKYADLVCAIQPQKTYLNLIFSKGASLPDPHGLLVGTGKRARHVKIAAARDITHPGLRELIERASGRGG